jgi:predicted MFS family arabinose efflux permease
LGFLCVVESTKNQVQTDLYDSCLPTLHPTKRVAALNMFADWKCMYITSNRLDQNRRTISISDIRTLWLSSLGSALEFYDFIIFVFFTAVIGRLFFPSDLPDWLRQLQTYSIFAVGYLARPLGGIVMGHFGDIYGRKRMFTLSVLLMAIPTLLIGFLPVYKSIGITAPLLLLLMRIMQGVAIGGEGPGAWVFVAEHARRGRTGLAIGLLTSGLTVGILLGSLMATGLNLKFSQVQILHGIWRLPFVVGGVFGLIALLLRRWLAETPVFEEMRLRATLSKELPLRTVLRDHQRAVIASMAITWVLTAAIVVVILMTPLLLQKSFSLPIRNLQRASLAGTAALALAVGAIGAATDTFGLRRVAIPVLFALFLSTYGVYIGAERMPSLLLPLYILAGIGAGAAVLAPILIIRAFPPSVRFSGFSLSYNSSYALFGGITPPLVSWIAHLNRINPAHYVAFVAFVGMITILLAPTSLASE